MNLSPVWVPHLEEAGYEVVHWSEVGHDDDSDGEIIAWATSHDHVVLTADLDFGTALARSGRNRPSVVQLGIRETRPALVAATVLEQVRNAEAVLQLGALLTIGLHRTRLTSLPLKS